MSTDALMIGLLLYFDHIQFVRNFHCFRIVLLFVTKFQSDAGGIEHLKNLSSLFVFLFLITFLNGCSKETIYEQDISELPPQTPMQFTYGEQTFEIVPFYEEVLQYTKLIKEDFTQNKQELYLEKVGQPLIDHAYEREVYLYDSFFAFVPPNNSYQLEENATFLLQHQDEINQLIKQALIKSSDELPGGDKTVYILPHNPSNQFVIRNMKGVSAWALNENAMFIQIDPSFSEGILQYIVAHEYHHTVQMETHGGNMYKSRALIDGVVEEGLADTFASIVYPEFDAPWTESLPHDQEAQALTYLYENANSFHPDNYYEFLYGNQEMDLPMWSMYKVGYKIVQSFIENNQDMLIEEWTKLRVDEIVSKSKYDSILDNK
jgi:uncharacterized protein YjaZ